MTNQTVCDVTPFAPDWVSPPGDTILDLIEERDWTQKQLAARLGFSDKHVNQLIKGKVPLTEDAAIRLENVLGASVGFWLKREATYRERAAKLDAANRHAEMVDWLELLPVKELMAAKIIAKRRIDAKSKPGLVSELLAFFGVAAPEQWESCYGSGKFAFRRSREEQSNIGAISAWLRIGERVAEKQDAARYDAARFTSALDAARGLTTLPLAELAPRLFKLMHEAGVTFVLTPAIPLAHVSGVARWLNKDRPLIQLSLYGKSNDRFWFTFFHEAAHILLHSDEKSAVFLDDTGAPGSDSQDEKEADAWARDFLIPPRQALVLKSLKTKKAVQVFATQCGVHPGIVVGRLQYEKLIDMAWFNDLKEKFEFANTN